MRDVLNTTLVRQRVSENTKDPFTVAIIEDCGRVVGHIPLGLSKLVSPFLELVDHRGESMET